MKVLYTTKAVASGGREGKVDVKDGGLSFKMAHSKELGGSGNGVNPEQLFAAGYSACFGSALLAAARSEKLPVKNPAIAVEVSIGTEEDGGFALSANIVATVSGISQQQADELVKKAHTICPYSKATRGNIPVTISAVVEG